MKFTKGNTAAGAFAGLWVMAMLLYFFDEPGKPVFLQVAPLLIDAMKWDILAFLGLNVVDNGVKGKFYNPALEGK